MPKLINLIGQTFNRLFITKRGPNDSNGHARWFCNCDCGIKDHLVLGYSLLNGDAQSCGCKQGGYKNRKHGLTNHQIYKAHNNMMSRCYRTDHKSYPYYGAKGVEVWKSWHDPVRFFNDNINAYNKAKAENPLSIITIERINPKKGYIPENVIWIPKENQGKSRRYKSIYHAKVEENANRGADK